jgi:RimJ/RimL family protein N-acetyltransferase
LEGVARGALFVRGRYIDMATFSLLRADWQASQGS